MESALETTRDLEFYRSLVALTAHDALPELLAAALDVLVARFGARETFIEIIDDDAAHPTVVAHGCDQPRQQEIAAFVSRGIISEALATGETVITANAAMDPRFSELASVQRHQLEAVLCVPIGLDGPVGILYLQGRKGYESLYAFEDGVQREVEIVARALALPIERLLARAGTTALPAAAPSHPEPAFRDVLVVTFKRSISNI